MLKLGDNNEFKHQEKHVKVFRDMVTQCADTFLKESTIKEQSDAMGKPFNDDSENAPIMKELSGVRRKLEAINKEKMKVTQELSYLILTLDEKEEKLKRYEKHIADLEHEKSSLQENLK